MNKKNHTVSPNKNKTDLKKDPHTIPSTKVSQSRSKNIKRTNIPKQSPQQEKTNTLTKNPRNIAVNVLLAIFSGRSLTDALEKALLEANPNDKPYIQHLLYGTLRQYEALNDHLQQLLKKPISQSESQIQALLILAVYEACYMNTAQYALVNQWVNLVKQYQKGWAANLVNAILRRILREGLPELKSQAGKANLPLWLLKRIKTDYPEQYLAIAEAYTHHPSFVLRINTSKISREDYLNILLDSGLSGCLHPYSNTAVILKQATNIHNLPLFEQGIVSVQDASAQLAASLLNPQEEETILDACAAPGGKTCHIWETQPKLNKLIALEIDPNRGQKIYENIDRITDNASNIEIVIENLSNYQPAHQFDAILLDAPCSATGIIHRHPDIKLLRQPEDIDHLVKTQAELLDKCFSLLKPNGRLLYATCSVLKNENEEQMQHFFERHQNAQMANLDLNFAIKQSFGIQILPKQNEKEVFDGFYYCLIHKKS